MTFLTRSNPFEDLRRVEARLFEPFFRFPFFAEEARGTAWNPPVDVVEEQEKLILKMEIPGIDEKDLRITFEDGLLSVSGERQFERKEDRNYHRIERAYGSFTRSFSLPRTVDGAQIVANYRNGVLEIEVPKREEAKPKQIAINVNAGGKQINE
ncbi:MAG: Hsp20/alpha crystallin family protein [Acidobacteria bacterium]|nr:Hsp20/alpha crystallin family protein [Acidobacteriota bacterium]MBV9475665.1 Hsp20/alpha crystallin family protein [Acidobacteriota bacterium]